MFTNLWNVLYIVIYYCILKLVNNIMRYLWYDLNVKLHKNHIVYFNYIKFIEISGKMFVEMLTVIIARWYVYEKTIFFFIHFYKIYKMIIYDFKNQCGALAEVAQGIEHWTGNQRITSSFPDRAHTWTRSPVGGT
ncbi:hypothetical protein HJG60_012188 [Phyllostomus discolor]|uniref:Uncharacterized protein n=1 Tax=Phyllostomus discolor TaxID=89673 RepID=A0A833ZFZ1_9CHIR|nr:hypothetical protein HJG60_012188 [Phyllostomus discolor]